MEKRVCYEGKIENKECGRRCDGCPSYGKDRRVLDRRKKTFSLRIKERREGFDRRQNHVARSGIYHKIFGRGALHLRNSEYMLILLLIAFNLLNILDFGFTLKALNAGFVEGNPVMDKFFSISPIAAGAFKFSLALFVTSIIWIYKRFRLVLEVSIAFLFVYMLLIAYHFYGAITYY